ncbi:uncharacterized protein [Procambarus clarkii]|uniref:uncharacterized protein n=1 Tax=Procambarus clarkii TaxID=6728 RepID=UPI001E67826A|nr:uncharacterized protein LOC123745485 [Procambarus clarkii]
MGGDVTHHVALLAASLVASWAEVRVYRSPGVGSCGDALEHYVNVSPSLCALHCNHNRHCEGYSFLSPPPGGPGTAGHCYLHQLVTYPDGTPGTTCYLPVPEVTTGGSNSATTTLLETITAPLMNLSTSAPSETTTSPGANASTITSLTTVITMSSTGLANLSDASHVNLKSQSSSCPNNTGAVGMFEMYSDDYLLCAEPPAGLTFTSLDPRQVCGSPTYRMKCMTASCRTNSFIVGFMSDGTNVYGPCSDGFVSLVAAVSSECHTISGTMQKGSGIDGNWKQWRICGGDGSKFFLMTGVGVTSNSDNSWTYDNITCCLVN